MAILIRQKNWSNVNILDKLIYIFAQWNSIAKQFKINELMYFLKQKEKYKTNELELRVSTR